MKTKRLSFNCPFGHVKKIDELAASYLFSRSAAITHIIEKYVDLGATADAVDSKLIEKVWRLTLQLSLPKTISSKIICIAKKEADEIHTLLCDRMNSCDDFYNMKLLSQIYFEESEKDNAQKKK